MKHPMRLSPLSTYVIHAILMACGDNKNSTADSGTNVFLGPGSTCIASGMVTGGGDPTKITIALSPDGTIAHPRSGGRPLPPVPHCIAWPGRA